MRKRLAIDLGDDYQAWLDLAKSLNQRPNTLARIVLRDLIKEYKQGIIKKEKYVARLPAKNQVDIRCRLNQKETASLDLYCREFDYSRARAVISILRTFLHKEVQFTLEERVALRESNTNLRAIGTNLNQIARRTNKIDMSKLSNQTEIRSLVLGLIERTKSLNDSILKHTKKVYELINTARLRK